LTNKELSVKARFLPILGALLLGVAPLNAQQANPLIGTWKINMAKSKFNPGSPPSTTSMNVYKPFGNNGITNDRTNSDGKGNTANFAMNFDGKDYPYKGSLDRDTVSGKQLSPTLFVMAFKRKGETIQINYMLVSDDGKSYTNYSMITDSKKIVDQRAIVYDRQ